MVLRRKSKDKQPEPHRRSAIDSVDNTAQHESLYRRNQTLTGYRASSGEEGESSRHKAHQLALQRRRLGGVFGIVLAVVAILGLLLWQFIAGVSVGSSTKQLSKPIDASLYESSINEYLTLNPAQRLRYSLDETGLSHFVSQSHPEVEHLSLSDGLSLIQAPITATFREPVAGWQMNNKQFYVDKNGVVFQKNYYNEPSIQIIDESGISIEQGSTVAGGRLLGFLGKVVAQAESRGHTVVKASLPAGTTREIDVYVDGQSTRLKFSIDRGAGEQFEDADRSMKYLASRGITPQYIDVRVAGRAAYR